MANSEIKASVMATESLAIMAEQVLGNMKANGPATEELLRASVKLQQTLSAAAEAMVTFNSAFGAIAVSASRGRADSQELGSSMQQLLSHFQTISNDRAKQARRLEEDFVVPLQRRLKSDNKGLQKMEDYFKSETRTFKQHMKKTENTTHKLMKQASRRTKSAAAAHTAVEKAMDESLYSALQFESFNQRVLCNALIEERSRYCFLTNAFVDVFADEFRSDDQRRAIQVAMGLTQDPDILKPRSMQLIEQTGSRGLMLEPPSPSEFRGDGPEAAAPRIEPSPITKEIQSRFLPPGCPPGGLPVYSPDPDYSDDEGSSSRSASATPARLLEQERRRPSAASAGVRPESPRSRRRRHTSTTTAQSPGSGIRLMGMYSQRQSLDTTT